MVKLSDNPKITLDGKTYSASKPKARLWRDIIKFNAAFGEKDITKDETALDQIYGLIEIAFKNPDVTAELVEDELDLEELMPKFQEICEWVSRLVAGKAAQIPNGQAPIGK